MKGQYLKKWLIIVLIFLMVIPQQFMGNSHNALAAQTGTVTATTLNVRAKASITAAKVQLNGTDVYLSKGDTFNVLSKEGDFYYVSLKFNGKTVKGYVHKDYVKVAATPKPTKKPTPTPKPTSKPAATPVPTKAPSSGTAITKKVQIKATVTASTLNVRSGPGTSYGKVAGLVKGNAVTIINETVAADKKKWYGISFVSNKKTLTGYVDSAYVKLTYGSGIKAKVSASSLNIKATAGSKAADLKYNNGSTVKLGKNKEVSIVGETTVSGVKWLKLSFVTYNVKRTGYAEASQIDFQATVATPTPTKAPTPKPTVTPVPTKAPAATPKVTAAPTGKPTNQLPITPSTNIINQGGLEMRSVVVYNNILGPVRGLVCNAYYLNVYKNVANSMEFLLGSNSQPVQVQSGQEVIVTEAYNVSGSGYYKVYFWYGGVINSGYVQADFIYISNITPEVSASPTPAPTITGKVTPTPTTYPSTGIGDQAYADQLRSQGFPESYIPALVQLHSQYPQWEFRPYQTGLDWNAVIAAESVPAKNLIPNSRSVEWKSLESGAYDWKTDTFTVYDGTTWVTASKEAIAYYMDPRNFLTANGIFQFELLKYQSGYQNAYGVENILKGTALGDTYYTFIDEAGVTQTYSYGETFIKAAEYSGVSPYHLASRVKQEVVTGSTTLSGSVTGKYAGYEGYYNFYNIGASDSAGGGAIAKGLNYAKNGSKDATTNALYMIPWSNPYKSIVGGSYFIGSGYINRGQDTIYLQKFNVTPISTFYHQYMTNVEAPYAEAKKVLTAYNGMADSPIIFSIPVYYNMPETASPLPITMFNPNNRLKSLQVLDSSGNVLALSPTFSQTELNYYIMVDSSVSSVQIKATTVSKKASILGGNGSVALGTGTNTITIPVIAENGEIANYNVTIVRAQ
ncbi:MAG TPA: SH3 domain-containing protein [Clostridiales bacterium]|nr:SH3 domain-containing protein [Clostridiales bacterium]